MSILDNDGNVIDTVKRPVGLETDQDGKYVLRDGEKIYFEFYTSDASLWQGNILEFPVFDE